MIFLRKALVYLCIYLTFPSIGIATPEIDIILKKYKTNQYLEEKDVTTLKDFLTHNPVNLSTPWEPKWQIYGALGVLSDWMRTHVGEEGISVPKLINYWQMAAKMPVPKIKDALHHYRFLVFGFGDALSIDPKKLWVSWYNDWMPKLEQIKNHEWSWWVRHKAIKTRIKHLYPNDPIIDPLNTQAADLLKQMKTFQDPATRAYLERLKFQEKLTSCIWPLLQPAELEAYEKGYRAHDAFHNSLYGAYLLAYGSLLEKPGYTPWVHAYNLLIRAAPFCSIARQNLNTQIEGGNAWDMPWDLWEKYDRLNRILGFQSPVWPPEPEPTETPATLAGINTAPAESTPSSQKTPPKETKPKKEKQKIRTLGELRELPIYKIDNITGEFISDLTVLNELETLGKRKENKTEVDALLAIKLSEIAFISVELPPERLSGLVNLAFPYLERASKHDSNVAYRFLTLIAKGKLGNNLPPSERVTHLKACLKKIKPAQEDNIVRITQGAVLQAEGKYAEALPYFEKIKRGEPHYVRAQIHRATCLAEQNNENGIRACLETLQLLDPEKSPQDTALIEGNLGLLYTRREKYNAALVQFRDALRLAEIIQNKPMISDYQGRIIITLNNLAQTGWQKINDLNTDEGINHYQKVNKWREEIINLSRNIDKSFLPDATQTALKNIKRTWTDSTNALVFFLDTISKNYETAKADPLFLPLSNQINLFTLVGGLAGEGQPGVFLGDYLLTKKDLLNAQEIYIRVRHNEHADLKYRAQACIKLAELHREGLIVAKKENVSEITSEYPTRMYTQAFEYDPKAPIPEEAVPFYLDGLESLNDMKACQKAADYFLRDKTLSNPTKAFIHRKIASLLTKNGDAQSKKRTPIHLNLAIKLQTDHMEEQENHSKSNENTIHEYLKSTQFIINTYNEPAFEQFLGENKIHEIKEINKRVASYLDKQLAQMTSKLGEITKKSETQKVLGTMILEDYVDTLYTLKNIYQSKDFAEFTGNLSHRHAKILEIFQLIEQASLIPINAPQELPSRKLFGYLNLTKLYHEQRLWEQKCATACRNSHEKIVLPQPSLNEEEQELLQECSQVLNWQETVYQQFADERAQQTEKKYEEAYDFITSAYEQNRIPAIKSLLAQSLGALFATDTSGYLTQKLGLSPGQSAIYRDSPIQNVFSPRSKAAFKWYKKACELKPDQIADEQGMVILAIHYLQENNFPQAHTWYQKTFQNNNTSIPVKARAGAMIAFLLMHTDIPLEDIHKKFVKINHRDTERPFDTLSDIQIRHMAAGFYIERAQQLCPSALAYQFLGDWHLCAETPEYFDIHKAILFHAFAIPFGKDQGEDDSIVRNRFDELGESLNGEDMKPHATNDHLLHYQIASLWLDHILEKITDHEITERLNKLDLTNLNAALLKDWLPECEATNKFIRLFPLPLA